MMSDFYSHPVGKEGLIRSNLRYHNLKSRLAGVRDGTDPWVRTAMSANPKIRNEIAKPAAVEDFCGKWLLQLVSLEKKAAYAQEDASA